MLMKNQETTTHWPKIGHTLISKKRPSYPATRSSNLVLSPTYNSLGSQSSSDVIIIDSDEEWSKNNMNKRRRLGSWWDEIEGVDELCCVVKGSRSSKAKGNDVVDSSLSRTEIVGVDELCCVVKGSRSSKAKGNAVVDSSLSRTGIVGVDELCCVVKGSRSSKAKGNDVVDLSLSPTEIEQTKKKEIEDERSLPSSHNHKSSDSSEDCNSRNTGNGHVTVEELGISVEDLKSMSWEAFDPTWEIRSETMDQCLGGYIKDMPISS